MPGEKVHADNAKAAPIIAKMVVQRLVKLESLVETVDLIK